MQTFRNRLVEVIDQAQHFAALGPAGGGGQSADAALTFREGLEVTERERESRPICPFPFFLSPAGDTETALREKYLCLCRRVQRGLSSGTNLRIDQGGNHPLSLFDRLHEQRGYHSDFLISETVLCDGLLGAGVLCNSFTNLCHHCYINRNVTRHRICLLTTLCSPIEQVR